MAFPYHIYRVLVAEDNYINQKLIKKLLLKKGYNALIVEDGKKVVDILQNQRYDMILMDIQMPIMDGYQATALIRERERFTGDHIPIIGSQPLLWRVTGKNVLQLEWMIIFPSPSIRMTFMTLLKNT